MPLLRFKDAHLIHYLLLGMMNSLKGLSAKIASHTENDRTVSLLIIGLLLLCAVSADPPPEVNQTIIRTKSYRGELLSDSALDILPKSWDPCHRNQGAVPPLFFSSTASASSFSSPLPLEQYLPSPPPATRHPEDFAHLNPPLNRTTNFLRKSPHSKLSTHCKKDFTSKEIL